MKWVRRKNVAVVLSTHVILLLLFDLVLYFSYQMVRVHFVSSLAADDTEDV